MKETVGREELNKVLIFSSELTQEKLIQLYEMNKGFLRFMIKRYCYNVSDYDDFMQIGYFALVKAVTEMRKKQDYAGSFMTYYKNCLRGLFFRQNKNFQFPINFPVRADWDNVQFTEIDESIAKLQDDIDLEEIVLQNELRMNLELALGRLSKTNAWIMREVYFNDRTMTSVGKELGISRDAVSKRIARSLQKLREDVTLKEIR